MPPNLAVRIGFCDLVRMRKCANPLRLATGIGTPFLPSLYKLQDASSKGTPHGHNPEGRPANA
jgi:hypothetical protein